MKNAADIISLVCSQATSEEPNKPDAHDVLAVLEDGAALAALGINNEDQEAVEEAHDILLKSIDSKRAETAKQTIARLTAWAQSKPARQVNVNWFWKGRDRSGIISLMENGEPILECTFYRGTQTWGEQDRDFKSCHTGSCKHEAMMNVANAIGA